MKWLRTVGIALGAVLLSMGLYMLGRPFRARKKAEKREIGFLAGQQKGSAQKAAKQALKAESYKEEAKQAAEVAVKKISEAESADITDLVSAWTK